MERLHRSARRALVLLVACLAVPLAAAWAQGARPTIALLADEPVRAGDLVAVELRGAADAAGYALRVEPPDGASFEVALTPVPAGARAEVALAEPGRHVLWLVGPDLEARFQVDVQAATAAPEPAPPPAAAPETPAADAVPPPTETPAEAPDADAAEPAVDAPEPTEAPGTEASPAPDATAPEAAPAPADAREASAEPPVAPAQQALALVVEDGVVVARAMDGEPLWRLAFPPGSGEVGTALIHLGRGWVALGHQVLALDLERGTIVERVATSGRVVDLRPVGTGVNVTSEVTAPGRPRAVEARLEEGVLTPPAVFDPHDAALFDALVREADVGDAIARLALDPTNPYLHLAVSRAATTEVERADAVDAALGAAGTFYDLARLARLLANDRALADADRALALAAADFEARGYDPALLTAPEVHERYGFPLRSLELALMRGDVEAAELWARWTYALSGPDLPGVGSALRAYAAEVGARGDAVAAATWRERAGARTSTSATDLIARAAAALGAAGATAAGALLVALAALHLTLVAKYGRARAVAVRQAREAGRRVPAWPWTRSLRYYGLTEKLVALGLLAAVVAVVALAGWVQRGDPEVALLRAGHLGAPALAALGGDPASDPASGAWVAAYRADRADDADGVRRALAVDRRSLAPVRSAVDAGAPVPTPSPAVLRAAVAGSWPRAIGDVFVDPRRLLDDAARLDEVPRWAWPAAVVAFGLVALVHVLALFVPRPRLARHAPRPFGYHVLALLLPGSGQADELYGLLLLLPWAVVGIDVLVQLFGGATLVGVSFRAGLIVLGVLYAVNVIAWAVEWASVRRRLRLLREQEPELARAFGLAPLATTAEDA